MDENAQHLTGLLQKQNQAGDLSNAYRLEDVKAKLALARESYAALLAVREFFLNSDRQYRRVLEQAQFDPLLVSIEMRRFNESQARRRPYLEEVFKALLERQTVVDSLLAQMQGLWGNWSIVGNNMRFSSSETQMTYARATAQLNEATDRCIAALNALAKSDESTR